MVKQTDCRAASEVLQRYEGKQQLQGWERPCGSYKCRAYCHVDYI